jgi:hypothetical protein
VTLSLVSHAERNNDSPSLSRRFFVPKLANKIKPAGRQQDGDVKHKTISATRFAKLTEGLALSSQEVSAKRINRIAVAENRALSTKIA